ncbi:MAG TPA: hypothetical protein VKO18_08150 [Terriglobia bacterium]|nr:hypothetical protein [Terriglobia bacterium]
MSDLPTASWKVHLAGIANGPEMKCLIVQALLRMQGDEGASPLTTTVKILLDNCNDRL